ncbi:hypothetical protein ACOMHN_057608 [Nucella lapillus]
MGFYLSRMTEALTGWVTPSEILILSLDNAGKTTTLYKLKMGDDAPVPIPTILSNIEETLTPVKGVTFTFLDVGGVKAIRQLWIRQHKDCSGILFVVDSADRTRLEESREELQQVCGVLEMKGVPVVVLANKQDLPKSKTTRRHCVRCSVRSGSFSIQGIFRPPCLCSKEIRMKFHGGL